MNKAKQLHVRLTEGELNALNTIASANHCKVSDLVRGALLALPGFREAVRVPWIETRQLDLFERARKPAKKTPAKRKTPPKPKRRK